MESSSGAHDHISDGEFVEDEQEFKQEQSSPSSLPCNNAALSVKPPLDHLQKRRRVTRACDECKRKKIKCDGKQPCTHCTVYSYECTYDQPSNRRRNPAPLYVENLEHRVHRAETLLRILLPNLDLNDSGIEAAVQQGWIPRAPGRGNPTAAQQERARPAPQTAQGMQSSQNKSDTNLESMVRAVAQLDMDERGHWDYHGHSSGLSFVRRMREQLGDLMGPDTAATPFVKSRPMSQILDSPQSAADSPGGDVSPGAGLELPPKDHARQMCTHAINDAAALLRVVHQPSFWHSFERLYNTPQEHYTNEDSKFLPMFHSAVALGHLFGRDEQGPLDKNGYEVAIQHGFAHFRTARQMMDIADCRDLTSIQAVVFMILFLQSSAKLSQCYAYVGVALRSALRMGLHRKYDGNFDPIEAESRKRVFWIVRKLDIYVGAMLGLPQTLSEEDIDQEFPLEVDDEYITKDGILPMPQGAVSLMTAFNAHTRIVQLLTKVVRKVYPIKTHQASADKSYSVPLSAIRELESDLEIWKDSLPSILQPCPAPPRYDRIQQLLRLSYAYLQVMLYRPFLHFVAAEKRQRPIDQRAYACAASYVNVSRNIVHIVTHMKHKGLLNGSFWFIMYTSFFAILSLVYFAAENPENPTTQAIIKDALEGKQILSSLARRSMAADRCTATLNGVFQRLPQWMQDGQQNPAQTRKRQFDPSPEPPLASRSHPDINVASCGTTDGSGQTRRASTFPKHGPQGPMSGSPSSLDTPWSQSGSSSFGPHTPIINGFQSDGFGQWPGQVVTSVPGGDMQNFSLGQNSFSNPALPDLSAMLFPAADEPFAYPGQPLTTFENIQQFARNTPYMNAQQTFGGMDSAGASPTVPPPSCGLGEDDIEAQFFALPPYIEQRQQQQQREQIHMPQQNSQSPGGIPNNAGMPFTNGGSMHAQNVMQISNDGNWMPQQQAQHRQDIPTINIGDLFGGAEWNPMLMNLRFQEQ